jgi:hypothetical protein
MGFFLSKAEKDIWMRDKGDHYEYVAVYVDDLLIASRAPVHHHRVRDYTQVQVEGIGPNSIWDATSFVTNMDD